MVAAGIKTDQESIAAAAEAYAEDKTATGDQAADGVLRLLEHARSTGLRPEARSIAASLAACVGGGKWRHAVPSLEKMVKRRDGIEWDEVMAFLDDARLEKRKRCQRVGEGRLESAGHLVCHQLPNVAVSRPNEHAALSAGAAGFAGDARSVGVAGVDGVEGGDGVEAASRTGGATGAHARVAKTPCQLSDRVSEEEDGVEVVATQSGPGEGSMAGRGGLCTDGDMLDTLRGENCSAGAERASSDFRTVCGPAPARSLYVTDRCPRATV